MAFVVVFSRYFVGIGFHLRVDAVALTVDLSVGRSTMKQMWPPAAYVIRHQRSDRVHDRDSVAATLYDSLTY